MSGHTHLLATFSEGPVSHSAYYKMPGNSLPGHIVSHLVCDKMPEHTHSLATFSQESAIQLIIKCQDTLTS